MPQMNIRYLVNYPISVEQYTALLTGCSLGARRPVDDPDRIAAMLHNAQLLITAWDRDQLVGAARSVTDYVYCCYLSDLAVLESCQRCGIGRKLIETTYAQLRPGCKIILLAAPAAREYYPHIGFSKHESAWTLQTSPFNLTAGGK